MRVFPKPTKVAMQPQDALAGLGWAPSMGGESLPLYAQPAGSQPQNENLPSYLFRTENRAHADGGSSPFIGDGRAAFVARRVCETFLGGVRFPKTDQSCCEMGHVHLLQAAILLAPYGVAMVFDSIRSSTSLTMPLAFALCAGSMVVAAHGVAFWTRKRGASVVVGGGEEEEVDFDGCAQASTLSFVCTHKGWATTLGHSVATAVVCFQALDVLGWGATGTALGQPAGALLHVLGWIAVVVALYSLGVHAPVEPSRHGFEVGALSRALHLCAALTPLQLALHDVIELSGGAVLALYSVTAAMPLLWALGSLPPADAAVAWLAEQLAVCAHGTGPAATPCRLAWALAGAWATALLTWGLSRVSIGAAVATASGVSALLSQGLLPALRLGREGGRNGTMRTRLPGCGTFGLRTLVAALAAAIFVCVEVGGSTAAVATDFGSGLGWALLGGRIVALIWAQLQQPFLLRFCHNCCYPMLSSTAMLWRTHLCLAVLLRILGSAALQILLTQDSLDAGSPPTLVRSVLIARALRVIWQSPIDGATELGVSTAIGQLNLAGWDSFGLPIQLLLVGFGYGRARDFLQKVQHVFVLLATSWASKAQRDSFGTATHVVLTVLLPLWIATAAAAAFLAAPLLPLLGAPCFVVGYPRPVWHAPPSRQPSSIAGGKAEKAGVPPAVEPDAALYQQMVPGLIRAVLDLFNRTSAGELRAGDMLMARYEDAIIWLSCHEAGYGYMVLSVAGLELKITSCHNVEGLRLDEQLAPAAAAGRSPCCNPWAGHVLLPLGRCTIEAYSSSPVRLAGIIDNRESLSTRLPRAFLKSLVWIFCSEGAVLSAGRPSAELLGEAVGRAELEAAGRHFPGPWAAAAAKRAGSPASAGAKLFSGCGLEELVAAGFALGGGLEMVDVRDPLSVSAHGRRIEAIFDLPLHRLQKPGLSADVALPQMLMAADVSADLRSAVVRAYRIAFKLVYDATLQLLPEAELEGTGGSDELADALAELNDSRQWHLGPSDGDWSAKMLDGTANLFTVSSEGGGSGTVDQGEGSSAGSDGYTARLLQLRPVELLLGKLNAAAVRGSWAALSHELHYLGTDDDERYSVQANTQLLRNITVEAAPPAVGGYPLFVSGQIECGNGSVSNGGKVAGPVQKRPAPAGDRPAPAAPAGGDSSLPYGGDMAAAMRAQDRDAIRQLMTTRQAAPPLAAVAPAQFAPPPELAVTRSPGSPVQQQHLRSAAVQNNESSPGQSWMDSLVSSIPDEQQGRSVPGAIPAGNADWRKAPPRATHDELDELEDLDALLEELDDM